MSSGSQEMSENVPSHSRGPLEGGGSLHIPGHELVRCIGQGAYGEVWLARSVLGTYRAIKIVYRSRFRDDRTYEREFRGIQQFEPVSRTNEGLMDILHAGRDDEAGFYHYVMELADPAVPQGTPSSPGDRVSDTHDAGAGAGAGLQVSNYVPKTLGQVLRQQGRLAPAECVRLGLQLTLALGHLHRHGLIHRDIKPSNIIFVRGIPKLADIGLVTSFSGPCSFVGTDGFIAPEGPVSPRADLFSLGKVLYEISTGKDRKDFPEPPTGLGEECGMGELAELNAVVLRACAAEADARYQTAEELHADLALLNSGRSVRRKRALEARLDFARKAGGVVALVALLAAGGWSFQSFQTRQAERLRAEAERLALQLESRNAEIQIRLAEDLFARGDASLALAHLAQILRRHPDHRVAAERLVAALVQRQFPRPTASVEVPGAPLALRAHRRPLQYSPDGRRLAVVGGDHVLRIWDPELGILRAVGPRHRDSLLWTEFSPDGRQVATASRDGRVTLLDVESGTIAHAGWECEAPVGVVRFDPAGSRLAIGAGSQVRLVDALRRDVVWQRTQTAEVSHLEFSAKRPLLASSLETGGVAVFDSLSGRVIREFNTLGTARTLRFSPDGRLLAAAVQNAKTLRWEIPVWEVETGNLLFPPLRHQGRIFSLEFSPDGTRLAVATANEIARVWDIAEGQILFEARHNDIVYGASFSPDGRHLLTASVDRTARIWDAFHGSPLSEPMRHEGRVLHARFSPDARHVVTLGWEDRRCVVWSVMEENTWQRPLSHGGWVATVAFSPTGERAATATRSKVASARRADRFSDPRAPRVVLLWNLARGSVEKASPLPSGAEAISLHLGDSGSRALVALARQREGTQMWLWDLEKAEPVAPGWHVPGTISSATFTADGTKVAVGTESGEAQVVDARWGHLGTLPLIHGARINAIAVSPDGRFVVTAGADGQAIVWEVETGRRTSRLAHPGEVWTAQFSSSGDRVLTGSNMRDLRVWKTDGTLVAHLSHPGPVEHAEFSPDGTRVVSALGSGVAHVWRLADASIIAELRHPKPFRCARFSPDGLRILTASEDGIAQLWDAGTGLKLGDPWRHTDAVFAATISPDGRHALTGSTDGAVLWEIPGVPSPVPRWLPQRAESIGGQSLTTNGIPVPVQSANSGRGSIPGTNQWEMRRETLGEAASDADGPDPVVATPRTLDSERE